LSFLTQKASANKEGQKQPAAKKSKHTEKKKEKPARKEEAVEEQGNQVEEEVEDEEEKVAPRSHCIKECELLIFQIYRLLGGSVCGC
jgi:hypothetical protein